MGNVISTILRDWPGLWPAGGTSHVPRWAWGWVVYVTKLAWKSTSWACGLTTVQTPSLPCAGDVVGKHPVKAVALVLCKLVNVFVALARHVIAPDLVMRQLLAVAVLQSGFEVYRYLRQKRRTRGKLGDHRLLLENEMKNASDYMSWKLAASQLDTLDGFDTWRHDSKSPYYDAEQVELKLRHIEFLMRNGDVASLRWHLRGELLRKHLGLTNPRLFGQSHVGTKRLVEDYTQAVAAALDFLCDVNADQDTPDMIVEKLSFFNETRHAFGRSAFLFSGGAMLGLYHMGVIKSLLQKKLLPRVISGASAGSIAAALLGTHTDDEMLELLDNGGIDLNFFGIRSKSQAKQSGAALVASAKLSKPRPPNSEPDPAAEYRVSMEGERGWHKFLLLLPEPLKSLAAELRRVVPRWVKERTLLDIEVLGECLRRNVGDMTFAEAYQHTGRLINITVTPHNSTDYPSLLNYLTAPHVLVWSAALASCAIPGVFAPVELIAKDKHGVLRPYLPGGLRWSDGSVECDLPMARLSELFNVNVFIVSQVNPHASLFAATGLGAGPVAKLIQYLKRSIKSFIRNVSDLGLSTFLQPLWRGLLPLVTQKYEGDCTIVPEWTIEDVRQLMANPTRARLEKAILRGMQSTWPKISWIRTHCLVEFTLDECMNRLRDRLEGLARAQPPNGTSSTSRSVAAAARRKTSAMQRVPSFTTSRSVVALADLAAGISGRSMSRDSMGSSSVGAPAAPRAASPDSTASHRSARLQRRNSWRAPLHTAASDEWVGGHGAGDDGAEPAAVGGLGSTLRLGSMARLNILDEEMVERAYAAVAARTAAMAGSQPDVAAALAAARRISVTSPPHAARFPGSNGHGPPPPRRSSAEWVGRDFVVAHQPPSAPRDVYPVGLPSDGESVGSPPLWHGASSTRAHGLSHSNGIGNGNGNGHSNGVSGNGSGLVVRNGHAHNPAASSQRGTPIRGTEVVEAAMPRIERDAIGAGAVKLSVMYAATAVVGPPSQQHQGQQQHQHQQHQHQQHQQHQRPQYQHSSVHATPPRHEGLQVVRDSQGMHLPPGRAVSPDRQRARSLSDDTQCSGGTSSRDSIPGHPPRHDHPGARGSAEVAALAVSSTFLVGKKKRRRRRHHHHHRHGGGDTAVAGAQARHGTIIAEEEAGSTAGSSDDGAAAK